ncbi:UDP-glucuronosyltransferase 2B33-like [Lytechinus variegatus]|uniref:UDP-glucuronosyltransferase 2B33-like n=1 Tax=Lytechinus variegatus TaxID=7654 RepID=UPI001BB0E6F6|nr:UDP-glucuronosyltransferase 2B33-like [Lytechinus variegatus]
MKYPSVLSNFILLFCLVSAECGTILLSAMFGEGSHFMASAAIAESLVKRGHNVTALIGQAYAEQANNPRFAPIFDFKLFDHGVEPEVFREKFKVINSIAFEKSSLKAHAMAEELRQHMVISCELILNNTTLLKELLSIDVILYDATWPCALVIKEHIRKAGGRDHQRDIPVVSVLPSTPASLYIKAAGSSFHFSISPDVATGYSNRMSFKERIFNVLWAMMIDMFASAQFSPYDKYLSALGSDKTLFDLFRSSDLYLFNCDFAAEFPFPTTPNIIPVGGLTTRPSLPLESELEDFVTNSGDYGVVVFTLGSYLTSMDSDILEMFAQAFERLPQRIIWQLRDRADIKLPNNVKIMPWLPQNDLLGHPKTRAFMYQGGNNGFYEAVYHAVPMVVIPFYGDQHDVAARVTSRGLGKVLDKFSLSVDIIHSALTDVITNDSYSKNIQRTSAIFRDHDMNPPDTGAFWVEHVMKYGGSYMRTPVNDLNIIQYYLIDVILIFIFSTTLVMGLLVCSCRFLIGCICKRRKEKVE